MWLLSQVEGKTSAWGWAIALGVIALWAIGYAACASAEPVGAFRPGTRVAGPEGAPSGAGNEQRWWIPFQGPDQTSGELFLEATVYRPPGSGPFPLAILNHGSPRDPAKRRASGAVKWRKQSSWFIARGYAVVVPMRRGYAASDGNYVEGYGLCNSPDFFHAGMNTAADILAVMAYMGRQSFVDPEHVLLVGQSAGGWGVLAASSLNPRGVIGIVNFAGGRGSLRAGEDCMPEQLVKTARRWGKEAHLPSLWVYSENDGYFGPSLSRRIAEAYAAGGAPVRYVLFPPFGKDGHEMFHSARAIPIWAPMLEGFLQTLRPAGRSLRDETNLTK